MNYEGVPYFRYLVRYVTTSGKRRRKVLYAPGRPWIRDTVDRWIHYDGVDVRAGSNVRVSEAP